MNTLTITPKSVPKDFASLQAKIECYQKVPREWMNHLTGPEALTVLNLIDRTIGWGRREAYFTTRAMLAGDKLYAGLPMSRRTLFRALASLEAMGLIQRRRDPNVPDRVHFTVNMEWAPDMAVKLPNRLQTQCHDDTTQCHHDTDQCHSGTLYTGITSQVSPDSSQAGATAPLPLSPAEKIRARLSEATSTHRAALARHASGPQAAVDAVDAAWRLALIDTFPGTAYRTWGVREKAQIKIVLKNWRGDIGLPIFVTWAVTNWTAIMRKQFKWMTRETPPAVPVLSFFIAFLTQFADCRAEGKLEEWLSDLDRTQLERMMGRGMTYEEATAELGKAKAAVALRSEMDLREVKVRARERGADAKLKQAEALAEFEGRAPIHPRSRAAEALRRAAETSRCPAKTSSNP